MIESPHSESKKRFLESKLTCKLFVFLIKGNLFFTIIDQILTDIHYHIEIFPKVKVVLQSGEHFFLLWIHTILSSEKIDELRVIVIRIIFIPITCCSNRNILINIEGFFLFNQLLKESGKVPYLFINKIFEIV